MQNKRNNLCEAYGPASQVITMLNRIENKTMRIYSKVSINMKRLVVKPTAPYKMKVSLTRDFLDSRFFFGKSSQNHYQKLFVHSRIRGMIKISWPYNILRNFSVDLNYCF